VKVLDPYSLSLVLVVEISFQKPSPPPPSRSPFMGTLPPSSAPFVFLCLRAGMAGGAGLKVSCFLFLRVPRCAWLNIFFYFVDSLRIPFLLCPMVAFSIKALLRFLPSCYAFFSTLTPLAFFRLMPHFPTPCGFFSAPLTAPLLFIDSMCRGFFFSIPMRL